MFIKIKPKKTQKNEKNDYEEKQREKMLEIPEFQ